MKKKRTVVKLIDYSFQHDHQLSKSYDDSNTMRGLSNEFDKYVIGRQADKFSIQSVEDYTVVFLPSKWSSEQVADYISGLEPDVLHMHGNSGWSAYPYYANYFRPVVDKMIFSPAGSSCGTPSFLSKFDKIIVNHPLQIKRMKCDDLSKVVVRDRAVDTDFFKPMHRDLKYDFVYIAGFVPGKNIPQMISTVGFSSWSRKIAIIGDSSRVANHYLEVKKYIEENFWECKVDLIEFMPQDKLVRFLGCCGVFVWPNIKPENPETTTNRSVVEALGCGMPLLLGERAFKETNFIEVGKNGFTYNSIESFANCAERIFSDIYSFRKASVRISKERFSYLENFIKFYDKLYSL